MSSKAIARLSALEVFPTLARYPAFNPRKPDRVRIGFLPGKDKTERRDEKDHPLLLEQAHAEGVSSLYHDLGVLAFAGCSAAHTKRIGDILERVAAWGGAASLKVRVMHNGVSRFRAPVQVKDRVEVSLPQSFTPYQIRS